MHSEYEIIYIVCKFCGVCANQLRLLTSYKVAMFYTDKNIYRVLEYV